MPNPIKMKKKSKRDGADETEFGMERSSELGSRTSFSSPRESELTEADGELRVSAAMDLLAPLPGDPGEAETPKDGDFDAGLGQAEIENPVAGGGSGGLAEVEKSDDVDEV